MESQLPDVPQQGTSATQDAVHAGSDAKQSRRSRKRSRIESVGPSAEDQANHEMQGPGESVPELSLQVVWSSVSGRTKVIQLPLNSMPRWDCTKGLHKRLVTRIFSESERPPSLTRSDYLQFNTSEECLNYPLDIARTNFRLVADHDGWQYVLHETSQTPTSGPPDFIHVVSIEFETIARVFGHLGIRMSMIAYPIVAINKVKLMDAVGRMRTDPNFKGIL